MLFMTCLGPLNRPPLVIPKNTRLLKNVPGGIAFSARFTHLSPPG